MGSQVLSVLCLSLGIALVFAGLAKLKSFGAFCTAVSELELVPDKVIGLTVLAVIVCELALGLGFIFCFLPEIFLWIYLVMVVLMFLVSKQRKTSDTEAQCLCFGLDGVSMNSWKSRARTALLIIGSGVGLILVYTVSSVKFDTSLFIEAVVLALLNLLLVSWITDLPYILYLKE